MTKLKTFHHIIYLYPASFLCLFSCFWLSASVYISPASSFFLTQHKIWMKQQSRKPAYCWCFLTLRVTSVHRLPRQTKLSSQRGSNNGRNGPDFALFTLLSLSGRPENLCGCCCLSQVGPGPVLFSVVPDKCWVHGGYKNQRTTSSDVSGM